MIYPKKYASGSSIAVLLWLDIGQTYQCSTVPFTGNQIYGLVQERRYPIANRQPIAQVDAWGLDLLSVVRPVELAH